MHVAHRLGNVYALRSRDPDGGPRFFIFPGMVDPFYHWLFPNYPAGTSHVIRRQELSQHDDPIVTIAGCRLVFELGDHRVERVDRHKSTFPYLPFLVPLWLLAWHRLDGGFGPLQEAIRWVRSILGPRDQVRSRVETEQKSDVASAIPAVKVFGLGEIGVTPQE